MIQISGMPFQPSGTMNTGSIERIIIQQMLNDPVLYSYPSNNAFLFEVRSRKNIIESANEMNESEVKFTTFRYARCNPAYWNLTGAGGFLLKPNVSPSEAIQDIYRNSSLYATECATACVIILYHAILKSIGRPVFNSLFYNLYLYSWHTDPDLGLYTFNGSHFLPGDIVYFNNPDFNVQTPWFRGLNAVVMSDGRFFGHGFGIMTADEILEFLNTQRQPGSNQLAYLTSLITRPSFNTLSNYVTLQRERITHKKTPHVIHHNKNRLSFVQHQDYLNNTYNN
ncbi:protein-glutamine gamma-glutamyltransferase [Alkalihalobacterium elongatum]|uniref:protein-glutamine gamma-glutamyltransferase n=1 Tax=Alkalihalobacterium elongatum TaxID=2675466 RepID=UPI001C1F79A9|nr:protein-glutamine gamma-glutamyltransferase [Alkalihalobacterium elongatum]